MRLGPNGTAQYIYTSVQGPGSLFEFWMAVAGTLIQFSEQRKKIAPRAHLLKQKIHTRVLLP